VKAQSPAGTGSACHASIAHRRAGDYIVLVYDEIGHERLTPAEHVGILDDDS
jgi:hypothetical protein